VSKIFDIFLPEKFQQLTTTAEVTSFCSMNEAMRDNVICGTGISDTTVTVSVPRGDIITLVPQLLHIIIKNKVLYVSCGTKWQLLYRVNLL
jgi:hypothetical protein